MTTVFKYLYMIWWREKREKKVCATFFRLKVLDVFETKIAQVIYYVKGFVATFHYTNYAEQKLIYTQLIQA